MNEEKIAKPSDTNVEVSEPIYTFPTKEVPKPSEYLKPSKMKEPIRSIDDLKRRRFERGLK